MVQGRSDLTKKELGLNYFSVAIWMVKLGGISFERNQSNLYTIYNLISVSMYTMYPLILLRSVMYRLLEKDSSTYVYAAFGVAPSFYSEYLLITNWFFGLTTFLGIF